MVLRPLESTPDARVDDYIKPYEKNWFWQLALKDWRRYSDIMLVALVANVLALSGMVFSMQVYDRVVPSQSEATLWVLFGGVMIAIVFEFIMRMLRVHISDVVGNAPTCASLNARFAHALRIKNGARSKSTGVVYRADPRAGVGARADHLDDHCGPLRSGRSSCCSSSFCG